MQAADTSSGQAVLIQNLDVNMQPTDRPHQAEGSAIQNKVFPVQALACVDVVGLSR